MPRYAHRIAFQADLFMTIITDSPDTSTEQLNELAAAKLREILDDEDLSMIQMEVVALKEVDGMVYARCSDKSESGPRQLENLTIENVEEISDASTT